MTGTWRYTGGRMGCRGGMRLALAVSVCVLLAAFAASAQEAMPAPAGDIAVEAPGHATAEASGAAAAAETVPGSNYRPGFLDTLNRWLGNSKAAIDSQLKSTGETLGAIGSEAAGAAQGATGVAQQAAEAVVGLPGTRLVSGREICPPAPNGAPDCTPASDALCRANGLKGGRSLEIGTAQKCPVQAWLSGRNQERACRTETFVLRAVCQ